MDKFLSGTSRCTVWVEKYILWLTHTVKQTPLLNSTFRVRTCLGGSSITNRSLVPEDLFRMLERVIDRTQFGRCLTVR